MPVVAISMSDREKEELDILWREGGFANRSEVMRHALQSLLSEQRDLSSLQGPVTAIVTVRMLKKRGERAQCLNVQHEYSHLITSSLHSHSTEGDCFDVIILSGDASEVCMMIKKLRGSRDAQRIQVNVTGG